MNRNPLCIVFTVLLSFGLFSCKKQKAIIKPIVVTLDANTDITDSIPDPAFRAYCVAEFGDGSRITAGQAKNATVIEVVYRNITSLKGLKFFTGLLELDCSANQIPVLDLSANKELIILKCSSNRLRALDISYNKELHELNCDFNKLTSLDISQNESLAVLSCIGNSDLATLKINNNKNLTELTCNWCSLTFLDVSGCEKLAKLVCYSNQIATLSLPSGTNIAYIMCYENQLKALDISNCTGLTFLNCLGNEPLRTIYVWRGFIPGADFYKDDTVSYEEK